jgi:homoserine dehydrogenase
MPARREAMKAVPLRLGIAGLGTVGAGLVELLTTHADRFARSVGRPVVVAAVSARHRDKNRGVSLADARWFDDAVAMAKDPGIDVLVELIGGSDGTAKAAVEAALTSGKPVVTANKALLARHGFELARLAESKALPLNFEAAVAGGIPVIKTMRESLVGNDIRRVYGILNGTCNFILTQMESEGRPFADVLAEAQALGYAEADPTFDIGGFDTAHKLALLTSLAFGTRVAVDQIHIEGIEKISLADIEAADDLGYRIKLLGVAVKTPTGIEQRVHPAMVPKDSSIAEVWGPTNAIEIEGDFVDNLLLVGPGAGGKPTASSVASDIADVARGMALPPFIVPADELQPYARSSLGAHEGSYYIRLQVLDRPGAMAAIATRMAEQNVSLESIVQRRRKTELPGIGARAGVAANGGAMPVILITHETTEARIRKALEAIASDGKVAEPPQMIRIEEL